ncbi:hormogonium polysaccharide biosynthesis protein HpsA [Spirulina major CS-329]|uniref:hormogonium polysaccharide biosynthesis protein HpsA n=1 Tax=Spirulina TaxID=1154 RepID=UPI0023309ACE|nr:MULTISPECIES: hormogonium polysaccharide biosynthesis protein HpsA [Spirulina]MDB9496613.1 hormogonium polysaccharide biosynthesis protein HpsA [Spirulina subsalsa CS-330]MDB9502152.1 hormogonium polysaccharide biosynthesis protein HpsA [Spirulina major CS-329]
MLKRLLKSLKILWQELIRLPQRGVRSLQTLLRQMTGQERGTTAGFVLPTVTMVTLVVVLTSATLVLRSMDRAKNASNFRVSQVVMNAAAPAIDRAKAKVENLFADPNSSLPRGTPADPELSRVLEGSKYTLEDEVRLQVAFDIDGGGINDDEAIKTAWRFPVDTDNNGKFDSFTLYGVYYQSTNDRARVPIEARTRPQVLNATESNPACPGAADTAASLVGSDGWYEQDGVLKKAFFTYVTNVPITDINEAGLFDGYNAAPYNNRANYENFKGNPGFTALEYQQDRARIPLGNNAIVTEDDLDFTAGTDFRISGRILTNGNFIASERNDIELRFYQVSSPSSCFYEEENGKVIVQGNVGMGRVQDNANATGQVDFDLFKGVGNAVGTGQVNSTNRSVTNDSVDIAYNTKAYEDRIAHLVSITIAGQTVANDPAAVRDKIDDRVADNPELDSERDRLRSEELEIWFRNRTRKVPAREVAFNSSKAVAITGANWPLPGNGTDELRPPNAWILPADGDTRLTLKRDQLQQANPDTVENEQFLGDRILVGNNLPAVWWDGTAFAGDETENTLQLNGQYWYAPGGGQSAAEGDRYRLTRARRLDDVGVTGRDGFWELMAAKVPEKKNEAVGGLRVVTGAGIYFPANANINVPQNPEYVVWPDWMPQPPDPKVSYITTEPPGSANNLRYLNQHPYRSIEVDNSGAPILNESGQQLKRGGLVERYEGDEPVYIDDELPATVNPPSRPYLKMRASAVYHYRYEDGKQPIACVSNFYDPTDWKTARNRPGLPTAAGVNNKDISSAIALGNGAELDNTKKLDVARGNDPYDYGFSNNGIVYTPANTSYAFTNDATMLYQANLVYPNGRLVNPMLKKALDKIRTDGAADLTIAERSAIDSTLCGLQILRAPTTGITETPRPGFRLSHGTIQEVAFLDGRQIKSVEKPKNPTQAANTQKVYNSQPLTQGQSEAKTGQAQYDLQLEHRLPMEIRATVIDMKKLRQGPANPNTISPNGADPLPVTEYMFPVSGIVYATRDDGLADASNRRAQPNPATNDPALDLLNNEPFMQQPADKISATDFWLDPTRRPNGIVLINGKRLNRDDNNLFLKNPGDPKSEKLGETEKGLTLVSNLPVYIKAEEKGSDALPGFNIHDNEEFNNPLTANWSNFYTRTNLNINFACRRADSRLPLCTVGDKWRPANILSDAATLLSDKFRFGFRNEGDYDIRNNQSDNLFRDPYVPIPGGRKLLHDLFDDYDPDQQAFLPATVGMKRDYIASNTVNFGNPDSLPNDLSPTANTTHYNDIQTVRELQGYLTDNSLSVNGLSSNQPAGSSAFVAEGLQVEDRGYSQRSTAATRPNRPTSQPYFLDSTYFNNFTTPVQRRLYTGDPNIPLTQDQLPLEYLMETCLKLPVSQCKSTDWFAYQDSSGTLIPASDTLDKTLSAISNGATPANQNWAGTTETPPSPQWQHYPRRVAFLRKTPRIENLDVGVLNPPISPATTSTIEPDFSKHSSAGFRYVKDAGAYFAPKDGDLMLSIEQIKRVKKRPIPIAILGSTLANKKPACYHYNAQFINEQKPTGTAPRDSYSFSESNPAINDGKIWFTYSDTATKTYCDKFSAIKTSLSSTPRNNVLWYATSSGDSIANLPTGDKDDYNKKEHPLAILDGDTGYKNGIRGLLVYDQMYEREVRGITTYSSPADAYNKNPDLTKSQPPLLPILQINSVTSAITPDDIPNDGQPYQETNWLPQVGIYANNIHYNMVLASGDTPVRFNEGSGGITNIPRLLENWTPGSVNNRQKTEIKGSLIQLQRSFYATAPFQPLYSNDLAGGNSPTEGNFSVNDGSVFLNEQRYPTGNGRFAYYEPSDRQWGFDVGMLSQLPDLFSQQFTLPPTDDPNEYFREVGRNDDWVQTLLCAKQISRANGTVTNNRAVNSDQRPNTFCNTNSP